MISIAILLVIIGFYLLYTTSKKMDAPNLLGFENKLVQHQSASKIAGFILLILSCILTIKVFGLGAGIFLFLINLMTVASLIVLLAPLKLFNAKMLFICMAFCVAVEFLVHIP
ncbi:hypothetical protein ACJOV8_001190 [Formosa sp. 3Alg 14/1]|uniref:hypothetical protein n=1 Tax=Formosa sp. 3Alg 14/1 TaxID=3382190 RepID=UPI0039BDE359